MFDAEPDIVAYSMMGYSAVAIGNHELYAGLDRMYEQIRWAHFPFLSANVFISEHELLSEAYTIRTMPNGLRVAIFGLTTPYFLTPSSPLSDYIIIKDYVEIARELVPRLRQRADIVIALTHLGIFDYSVVSEEKTDEDENINGEIESEEEYESELRKGRLENATTETHKKIISYGSVRLAFEVEGIDLIVDGHSHTVLSEPLVINNTPIVQSAYHGRSLGRAKLHFDADTHAVSLTEWENIPLSRRLDSPPFGVDTDILNAFEIFKNKIPSEFNQIIGSSDNFYSIENIRNSITPLGQIVANSTMYAFKQERDMGTYPLQDDTVDLGIYNSGGIRRSLPQGQIAYYYLHEILPFGNNIVKFEIIGKDLERLINFSFDTMVNTGGFLQFSSNVEINKVNDHWITMINGAEIDHDTVYTISTNSFVATGEDAYRTFLEGLFHIDSEMTDREALQKYIANREYLLHPPIIVEEEDDD